MHLCTVGDVKFTKQCVVLEENGPGVIVAATEDAKSACELASSADPCAMIACKSSLFLSDQGWQRFSAVGMTLDFGQFYKL